MRDVSSAKVGRGRVRAPELIGRGGWINTGGEQLTLADLRGRIVILDFWTFCCVNCLHVLDELRPLEEKYADVLVVVGVHSPKFVHEADHDALLAAVERYGVRHPVLDDPELATWSQYAVRAWPTLAVIDPEGYVVAQVSGEGHAHALDVMIAELIEHHESAGTLRRGDSPFVPPPPHEGVLRFPARTIALDDGSLLVADAGHHRLVHLASDGETLLGVIGSGEPGFVDGATPSFNEPNGVCLLPSEIRARVGYDAVVADTVNHALRGVNLATGEVTTLAGTGAQWMQGDPLPLEQVAGATPLSSPWDVAWFEPWNAVAIAMAGNHQLWSFDPVTATVVVRAGTTNEGMVDGQLTNAWFAQTSGLAVDGETLWLADSETSSLRRVRNGLVHSEIGRGLFDFGHIDGPAADALLQHPLGVAVLPDGSVAIADTYNGAIRRFDPESGEVSTIATGLAEPSGVLAVPDEARGVVLLVTESAAHRLTRVPLPSEALRHNGSAFRSQRPSTDVAPGEVALAVLFTPPSGQKLDDRYGPSTFVVVSASPPELLVAGAGSGTSLTWPVVIADPAVSGITAGVLHVSARAASCDDPDAPGAAEFPACHVHQQDWGVPVRIVDGATSRLALILSGLDA